MYMKRHILAAMREEFDRWEWLLAQLSEKQICDPSHEGGWAIKDEIAHLWAWQQRTVARMDGGLHNRPPELPQWLPDVDPQNEDETNRINAWIFETNRGIPWPEVYQRWRAGFLRLLDLAEEIPERVLLDAGCYDWLEGYSLAFILLASYDHHHEHLEKLLARLSMDQ